MRRIFLYRYHLASVVLAALFALSGCDDSLQPGSAAGDSGGVMADRAFWPSSNPDIESPIAEAHGPQSTGNAKNAEVFVRFNEPLRRDSDNVLQVKKVSDRSIVDGRSDFDEATSTFRFIPLGRFAPHTWYIASLTRSVADGYGNSIGVPFSWTFETDDSMDPTPFNVFSVQPRTPTLAELNAPIVVTFTEPVYEPSVTAERFVVTDATLHSRVEGPIVCDGIVCTLTPREELRSDADYIVNVSGAILDADRHVLSAPKNVTFHTRARVWSSGLPTPDFAPSDVVSNNRGDALVTGTRRGGSGNQSLLIQQFDGITGQLQIPEPIATPPIASTSTAAPLAAALSDERDVCLLSGIENRPSGIVGASFTLFAFVKNGRTGIWSVPSVLATLAGTSMPAAHAEWDGLGHCLLVWRAAGALYSSFGSRDDVRSARLWSETASILSGPYSLNGDVTDFDLDRIEPGHLRLAFILRPGLTAQNRIYTRDFEEEGGWTRLDDVGSAGYSVDRIHQEVNGAGDSRMVWLKDRQPTRTSTTQSELWASRRDRSASTWQTPEHVTMPGGVGVLRGAFIRSAGFADTGEFNVNYSEYRANGAGEYVNMDRTLYQSPSHAWAERAALISDTTSEIRYSAYDRYGGGIALATTLLVNVPNHVFAFAKPPTRSTFEITRDRTEFWRYLTTLHVQGSMDRNGRVFSFAFYESPETHELVTEYRWLR